MAENGNSKLASELIQAFFRKKSRRGTFEAHCKEVADRVMPDASKEFDGGSKAGQTEGEENSSNLNLDSTAAIALGRYASILDTSLTPRNAKWHKLTVTNPELAKERDVKLFFEEANDILFRYRYSPKANFASQNHRVFKYNGAFGNGVMFIDELDSEPGVRYKSVSLGSVYISRNHQGIIDGVDRHFKLSATQAAKKWGKSLPKRILDAANSAGAEAEQEFEFLHVVKPNAEINPLRIDAQGMAFQSFYISIEGKAILEQKGYRTFPYPVSGGIESGDELYDRSPAMQVLPSIRTLNEQKRTVLKQGHRIVDPVLLSFDDGIASRFSLRPGAVNSGGVTKDGKALVQVLPTGNLAVGKDMMDDERRDIQDVFLVTLFQILVESPQRTATEVLEIVKEKGILLSPAFSKQESGYLGPTIERELDVLAAQNLLPPIPDVLLEAQGEYTIVYDSPFSRAQRAEEAAGLMRVLEWAMNVAGTLQAPEVLDPFDMDIIVPELAEIHGIPHKWLRAESDVEALRQGRQAQLDAQNKTQAAPNAAALIKAMAEAKNKAPEEYDAAAQALQQEAG